MTFIMRLATTSILLATCYVSTHSFTPTTCTPITKSSTALYLLPSQGCQLAAASAAASVKEEDHNIINNRSSPDLIDGNHPELSAQSITPTQAARVFAWRVFSIPTHILPNGASNNEVRIDDKQDDVVLFPIVGFTFVKGENEEVQILPSPDGSVGACNIDSIRQTKELPLYGWFSPCCKLGDVYADDQMYCGGIDSSEVAITDLQN